MEHIRNERKAVVVILKYAGVRQSKTQSKRFLKYKQWQKCQPAIFLDQ